MLVFAAALNECSFSAV